jgi:hypothetical protein
MGIPKWYSSLSILFGEVILHLRSAHSNGDVSRYHILVEPAHTILAQAFLGVLRLDDSINKENVGDNSPRQIRCPTLGRPCAVREPVITYTRCDDVFV